MSSGSGQPGGQGAGLAVGVLAGVVGVGTLTVWTAGAIGGVLAGNGPQLVGLSQAARVLRRLPGRLEDPGSAWPQAVAEQFPASAGVMLAAVVLALLLACALVGVLVIYALRVFSDRPASEGAEWASKTQSKPLHVSGPERGRIVIGRHDGQLLAAEPRASVLVVAPSQAHKTTGLAVPALIEWDGPVLATSIKGDLVHDTIGARAQRGEVRIFDPTGSTGLAGASWSPIAASSSWEQARRMAARLMEVGSRSASSGGADANFWRPAGARYLAPLLLAAAHTDASMGQVLSWVSRADATPDELSEILLSHPDPGAKPALEALESVWAADERFRSSVVQTIATALDAWQEPGIAAATASAGAIDAQWLLSGSNTLYLVAPAAEQDRLRGLFCAIVADVIATAFAQSTQTGRPVDPPLLACLDEAANVASLPNLDEIASTGAGQGVQLLTVLQNLSQASERWGKEKAQTIVANHRAKLFGAGIADRETLEYLGAILGEQSVAKDSVTRDRSELDLGSRTLTQEYRRLGAPDRLRQAEEKTALLVYGRLAPAWVKLRPWYEDRKLKQLAELPAPPLTPAAPVEISTAPAAANPWVQAGARVRAARLERKQDVDEDELPDDLTPGDEDGGLYEQERPA